MQNRNTVIIAFVILILAGVSYFAFKDKEVSNTTLPDSNTQTNLNSTVPDYQATGNTGVLGNSTDLISFSILPGKTVHGIISYRGVVQGGYFFEGNILINVLDANTTVLKKSNAVATTDWMTTGPVDFEGNIDFTGLPKGPGYIQIHNDNASGLSENDKEILIPIIIE